jgi:uncharacterized protein (TIGR00159 family)
MSHLLEWRGLIDLFVLAAAIYFVLHWSRQARALRVTFGILALEAGAIVSTRFGLPITSWVLHASAVVAALVLIVLFQPELRHALNRLEITLRSPRRGAVLLGALEAIADAAFSLAAARRGALLVIERRDPVAELVRGGIPLGGQVSPEILEAIFRKVSPVHDGATLIEGDHITRVGAILPLSHTETLPRMWGTRHRAGMGLAERCDALVIVASEERGEVTLMHDARFETVRTSAALLDALRTLMPPPPRPSRRQAFNRRELGLLAVAAAMAFAIWASVLYTGSAVRVRTVPLEFTNVAPGLRITEQSAVAVTVRLRGSSWLLDSPATDQLVVRVSLAGLGEGDQSVEIAPALLRLPLGVFADDVSPDRVRIRLRGPTHVGQQDGGRESR